MSSFISFILSVFAIYQAFANNQICLNEVDISFGYFLPFSCFRKLYEISLINCAKECLYRQSRCKSINYIRSALSCSLCEDEAGPFKRNLIEKPGRTHSDIAKWPKDLAGRCKDVFCPPTHSCNPLALSKNLYDGSDTLCVLSGCGLSPSTNWSTKSTYEEIIGTRVKYSCLNGMTQRGNPIIECQANGTWTDFNFTCGCGLSPSTNWSTKSTYEEIIGTRVKYSCLNGMTQRGNPIIECQANGTWTDFNFTCAPRNCKDIRDNVQAITGIYLIYPSSDSAGIPVRCDMTTDGGGWTVFQRRVDGSKDFYRRWGDYTSGFGDLNTEFWLGLDIIHALTSQDAVELRVDLVPTGSPAKAAFAKYATFHVGDESSKYVLKVDNYSGNAGDSLTYHNGMAFSTMDRDNDHWDNCAITYHGAWWYNSCHLSNLNGDYGNTMYGKGISWQTLSGHTVSMMFTEMKLRGQ